MVLDLALGVYKGRRFPGYSAGLRVYVPGDFSELDKRFRAKHPESWA